MPGKQRKRSIILICKYCGESNEIETEETTADEYNTVQKGCNDALKDVSPESGGTLHHKITEALKRLRDEFGFGIPDNKEGETNDEYKES